jgi:diguanylate cyclase (GGDEF)-like protein
LVTIDVLSAYAVCGGAALTGALLLRPEIAQDEAGAEAVTLFRWAFVSLGMGLVLPLLSWRPLPLAMQALLTLGALGTSVLMAWALTALTGRVLRRLPLLVLLGAIAVATALASTAGTEGLSQLVAWGLAAGSALMLVMGWRLLRAPRNVVEWVLGLTLAGTMAVSLLRALWWFVPGRPEPGDDLMALPPGMATAFGLIYGGLPILYTTLLLNIFNARLRARLRAQASTDDLTGALSRRALAVRGERLRQQSREPVLAAVMIDLDHFKGINDRHGHAGGDAALRQSADALRAQLRPDALLARFGGEEFVVLAPVPEPAAAAVLAERLRRAVEAVDWPQVLPGESAVTASLGVACWGAGESLETALGRADAALYRAKDEGRNRVSLAV